MKDSISPEEKLLKLIKGSNNAPAAEAPRQANNNSARENKAGRGNINPLPGLKNLLNSLGEPGLIWAYIMKAMPFMFIASVIYLVSVFVYPWFGLKKIKLPDVSKEKIEEPLSPRREENKPFEFYSREMQGRQLFIAHTGSSGAAGQPQPVSGDLIKDINLIGIISGENPQAVIEDKKTKKSYYLSKGQFIGDFQVEDIQEGKIILNYNGTRYELYI